MTRRRAPGLWLAGILALAPGAMSAQSSVYGIHGLGFPGRALTPRARALGGGFGVFDPLSPLNPATVAGAPQVTALAMFSTDFRGFDAGGASVGGLHITRFPLIEVAGHFPSRPIGYGLSVSQYTERSFDVTLDDTVTLDGVAVPVSDRNRSVGGISDVRGAVAWAPHPRFRIGAGVHFISGSAKLTLSRGFGDSTYLPFERVSEEEVSGFGVSAGFVWAPVTGLEFAAAGRHDTDADLKVDGALQGTVHLPTSAVAGLLVRPQRGVRVMTTVAWHSWSKADPDLTGSAFDTWEVGGGIELGSESGRSRVPLRLGARYATLPFGPAAAAQAHELNLAAGTGVAFAGNRGLIDVSLERAIRDGGGARERAWQLSFSLTVRP